MLGNCVPLKQVIQKKRVSYSWSALSTVDQFYSLFFCGFQLFVLARWEDKRLRGTASVIAICIAIKTCKGKSFQRAHVSAQTIRIKYKHLFTLSKPARLNRWSWEKNKLRPSACLFLYYKESLYARESLYCEFTQKRTRSCTRSHKRDLSTPLPGSVCSRFFFCGMKIRRMKMIGDKHFL